ncbi:MAG TPA: hypothetical protein VMM12_08180 [Longimicrobiales bacterium]|nr:hypothetical protein [Longimicrobiales bacterium]
MTKRAPGAGWSEVSDQILLGLAHDINNRLLALMGVRELAEDGVDGALLRLFDEELARLGAATRLIRRLAEPTGSADVAEAKPLLTTIQALHARNAALRRVRTEWAVEGGLPAVRLDAIAAERGILRVLASSGHAAAAAGTGVRVAAREEAGAVVLDIAPFPADAGVLAGLDAAGAEHARAKDGALRIRLPRP